MHKVIYWAGLAFVKGIVRKVKKTVCVSLAVMRKISLHCRVRVSACAATI